MARPAQTRPWPPSPDIADDVRRGAQGQGADGVWHDLRGVEDADGNVRWGRYDYDRQCWTPHEYIAWRWNNQDVPTPEEQGHTIYIWYWSDAPGELQALSGHGGDEDFVLLFPDDRYLPSWLEDPTPWSPSSDYELADGRTVSILAHA